MGFKQVEIGDIGLTIADGNYSSKYPRSSDFVEVGVPFIRANNMKEHQIIDGDMYYISPEQHEELKKGHLEAGDVLITTRGNLGSVAIISEEFTGANINAQIALLRSDNKIVLNRFLMWCFETQIVRRQIIKFQTGTALKQLPIKKLKKIMIPLPPIQTQRKIVQVLDKAQELIDLRKAQIEMMDELIQSVFYDMFGDPVRNEKGWEVKELNDVCLGKPEYGSGSSAIEYSINKPRYIRITDINNDGSLNDNKKSPGNENDFEKYRLVEGDLLFARSGATVGKTYLYRNKDGNCIFAGYLIRFKSNRDLINPEYFFRYTKTYFYEKWIENKQNAVAQPNINAKQYGSELDIPVPPLELQNKFAQIVEKIEAQKALMQESLKEMEDNFNALMQRAFRGEV